MRLQNGYILLESFSNFQTIFVLGLEGWSVLLVTNFLYNLLLILRYFVLLLWVQWHLYLPPEIVLTSS